MPHAGDDRGVWPYIPRMRGGRRLEDGSVECLACGDAEDQGHCTLVAGEVHFRDQAAARVTEDMVIRFGPAWRPLSLFPRHVSPGRLWSRPRPSSRVRRPLPGPRQGGVPGAVHSPPDQASKAGWNEPSSSGRSSRASRCGALTH